MKRWLAALIFVASAAGAADQTKDFAYGLPLVFAPGESFYRVELPPAVYANIVRADVGDLRVFNAAGEVVPHALLPRATAERNAGPERELPQFPLFGDAKRGIDSLDLRVETSAGRTTIRLRNDPIESRARVQVMPDLLGIVLDASAIDESIVGLTFELPTNEPSFVRKLSIEASDDLRAWQNVAREVAIVKLEANGMQLRQNQVALQPRRAKYYRITWQGPSVYFTRVTAQLGERITEPLRRNADTEGKALVERAGEYEFDSRGRFPIDRLRIRLPQPNTVVEVEVLARAQAADPWRSVTRRTVYRIVRDGQEVESPEIAIALQSDRYWLLRVDQRGGGVGSGVPALVVGWLPHELVFAARGGAPFQLAYGSRSADRSALPIESLVPGWKPGAAFAAARAEDSSDARRALGGEAALNKPFDAKNWILWSVLVVAVALLGWMASRVLRKL